MRHTDFLKPLINPDEILSDGPPPDGIPAIDNPKFERAPDVDWLADGEVLTFVADGGRFTDEQSGSTWNICGQAVDGELDGATLDGYPFIDTFWKRWVAFRPDTRLVP